jgi:high-affinity iron transporter
MKTGAAMLTNTVVLFLRDLLPMFIMFAYLQTIFQASKAIPVNIVNIIAAAAIFSILVFMNYEFISDSFEGTGIEWLKIALLSISFISFLVSHIPRFVNHRHLLLAIASCGLLVVHLSSFLLYFTIYIANEDLMFELLIGCAVGIGICVSFYFLFRFCIQELWISSFNWLVLLFWSLFVASQLSFIANYLHQIDVVTFGATSLLKLSDWVKEGSEYGFILKALTGFDNSASLFYDMVLLVGFAGTYALSMMNRRYLLGDKDEH